MFSAGDHVRIVKSTSTSPAAYGNVHEVAAFIVQCDCYGTHEFVELRGIPGRVPAAFCERIDGSTV